MPTNVFFSSGTGIGVKSEQYLMEDLIIESIKIYGIDVYYIPRSVIRSDEILNEEYSRFKDAYVVEMYVANPDAFDGEGNILSKFGLEIRDQVTLLVARRRFEQLIQTKNNDIDIYLNRPREGDLIYFPLSNSLFEIKFVEHEKPFYQLSQLPLYEMQCELFEYNSEEFDTGKKELDAFQNKNASQITIEITGGAEGWAPSERFRQTLSDGSTIIQGTVSAFEEIQEGDFITPRVANLYVSEVHVVNGNGWPEFEVGLSITSMDNPDKNDWIVSHLYTMEDGDNSKVLPHDPLSQNAKFEVDADEIIDWSNVNPFGEPSLRQTRIR